MTDPKEKTPNTHEFVLRWTDAGCSEYGTRAKTFEYYTDALRAFAYHVETADAGDHVQLAYYMKDT